MSQIGSEFVVVGEAEVGPLVRPLAERAASRRSEAKLLASLKPASSLAVNYIITGLLPSTVRAGCAVPNCSRQFGRMGDALLGWSPPDFNVNKKAPRLREGLFHLLGAWR